MMAVSARVWLARTNVIKGSSVGLDLALRGTASRSSRRRARLRAVGIGAVVLDPLELRASLMDRG
ncbi:hypothetical protein GCM10028781_09560 [Nostocoides australiense]